MAPYVGLSSKQDVTGLTLDQLFADLDQNLTTSFVPMIQSDFAMAEQYGVPLVAYEGGQSLDAGQSSGPMFTLMSQAQNDPRMYQFYVNMIDDWQQADGQLFDAYQLSGNNGSWGFWGMLPNVTAAGSQKYDALLSTILPPGDANADGVVDYPDFQALQANYGQGTTTYWSQGDFNDDGTTNWSDLNILRQNLAPSGFTVAQFAQQAVFGEPATVDSPTALEYDGYGVTYAGSQPFASSSGTVKLNQNSAGQPIVLGGASYSEGLGVTANSSATIALDGAVFAIRQHHRRGQFGIDRVLDDLRALRGQQPAVPVAGHGVRILARADRRQRRRRAATQARRGARSGDQRRQ